MYFKTSIIFFLPCSLTREIIFSSNLICMCTLGLVRISFFELRSFGSNQHRIFKASEGGAEHILLSNKGRNLCVSAVCLHFYYVENYSSNRLHACWVCCCGPKPVQCLILVQYGHAKCSELINYRTAWAGCGSPHKGRVYMLRERTLHYWYKTHRSVKSSTFNKVP